jgi:acetyl-CoA C-acetyltransferase
MKAAMMAFDRLALGHADVIAAGGMESMSNAPYLLPKMRGGARIGHQQVQDHMFLDGLEDAYDKGRLMGTFAEDCAEAFQFTREAQDDYALKSLQNALDAQASGAFDGEITPVTLTTRKGEVTIGADEQPGNARPEKIPHLKPAFRKDGTVTPANSCWAMPAMRRPRRCFRPRRSRPRRSCWSGSAGPRKTSTCGR